MKTTKIDFDFMSDVHLDFWVKEINPQNPKLYKQINKFIENVLKPKTKEILIIAGDLGHYFGQDTSFLLELKKYYKNIFITPGNHDLYLVTKNLKKKYMKNSFNRILEMKRFCKENEGFYYLDGEVYRLNINDTIIRIGGLGMWHDYSYGLNHFTKSEDSITNHWLDTMNDAVHICVDNKEPSKIPLTYSGYMNVSPFDTQKHFKNEYKKLSEMEKCDIMVTHYPPILSNNLPEKYKNLTTTFYVFDGISELERISPKVWIHGHQHHKIDDFYKDTNIICNPIGYPGEVSNPKIMTYQIEI